MTTAPPIALTIAGSDSSGGAGIQADLKTFTALGVYGASVVTALTAQNTRGVDGVFGVPPDFISRQIASVAADLKIGAVKTGMLGDRVTVETVARAIRRYSLSPLVVDPVMVATSGDVLLQPDAIDAVRLQLIALADVITPNLPEAAKLLDQPVATTEHEMERQARRLLSLGCRAVLIKGGHFTGTLGESPEAVDILVTAGTVQRLASPRVTTRNTHGTGCTLSAALAANLARGLSLTEAAHHAKTFVFKAIEAGAAFEIGQGAGPVDHLFAIRKNGPAA